jgi:hypothetical protein
MLSFDFGWKRVDKKHFATTDEELKHSKAVNDDLTYLRYQYDLTSGVPNPDLERKENLRNRMNETAQESLGCEWLTSGLSKREFVRRANKIMDLKEMAEDTYTGWNSDESKRRNAELVRVKAAEKLTQDIAGQRGGKVMQSRYSGVTFSTGMNRWAVSKPGHEDEFLGFFPDEETAAKMWDDAAVREHYPDEKLNFPRNQKKKKTVIDRLCCRAGSGKVITRKYSKKQSLKQEDTTLSGSEAVGAEVSYKKKGDPAAKFDAFHTPVRTRRPTVIEGGRLVRQA